MKKIAFIFLLLFFSFSVFAVTEYDIGGGQTLILNDDGTYEIVLKELDYSSIIGMQYKLDLTRSLDPLITLAMMDDPSLAILGKEYFYSLIEETGYMDAIASEIPDISFVFLSQEKVLVIVEDESPLETDYRIDSDRTLTITNVYGEEFEFGTFSEDFTEIEIISEGIPFFFVQ